MNIDDFYLLSMNQFEVDQNHQNPRKEKVYKELSEPLLTMSDYEFRQQFRFSKDAVQRLSDLVSGDLETENNRGLPVPPLDQVLICLNHLGGGHFQRTSGWCYGVSQSTPRLCIERVVDAIIIHKDEFVFMPDTDQMTATSERMYNKFSLPRLAYAVDGMQVRFAQAPRGIPNNIPQQLFWCRKQCYAINVQLLCDDRFILDVVLGWPGSVHDSRIWKLSEAKAVIETQRRFFVAGDSGYPISENLMKPYSTQEAGADRRKRLFNQRLSGARTMMSECIFGALKRRWPILTGMRNHFVISQKIILATAILFNIGRLWGDLWDEDSDDEDADGVADDEGEADVVVQENDEASVRIRGQLERDRLKDAMP